ncbi:MAG: tRNA epoxyqueuosine(34) reductase QueG [Desulfosporosinus sp.]|jgi:epoxyqueuosine reductase
MDFLDQRQWKENIKKWVSELGFVSIGFTTAESLDSLTPSLQARIDQGLTTPFESKEIKLRLDPKTKLHSCQTVVALAYPLLYSSPSHEGEGVIARSAVGEDYHRVLRRKMNQLVGTMIINGWTGTLRWQVDNGPLVERAFALRAGIGWIGRNQNLIIPGYGSFIALALLLLDQEIEPDYPTVADQCGTCQRCVQACPAQILGKDPFAAKHCVSYLTQSKELLKTKERGQLGLRIFGCDTCQEVCPHNQKRIAEEQACSSSSSLQRGVDLMEILNLTKDKYQSCFKDTAAGWRGKGVLQRNAFLAALNSQDERYKSWLEERQKDNSVPPIIKPYLS